MTLLRSDCPKKSYSDQLFSMEQRIRMATESLREYGDRDQLIKS